MVQDRQLLLLKQQVSSSSMSTSRQRSAKRVARATTTTTHLQVLSVLSSIALAVSCTTTFLGLDLFVDAVGPKYIKSTQSSTTRSSTRSKQQHRVPPQKHPWTAQRSVVGAALQPPTTRHFLDQCVSFLDLFEVIALRGGETTTNKNGNGKYYNDPSSDEWSNVNTHPNHPNQYDDGTTEDDEYYYGRPSAPQRRRSTGKDGIGSTLSSLPKMLQTVDRKTGLMLLVSGVSVTFLGITLFFNKTIIRLGHLLCIAGVLLSMGLSQTIQYFVQPEKLRATICLGIGLFLVFVGSPLFGIALEVFGILNLFGNMFPIVMSMIKQMPIIGTMLKSTSNSSSRSNSNKRSRDNDDDYYSSNDSRRQPSSRNQYDYDNREDYSREEDEGVGRRY